MSKQAEEVLAYNERRLREAQHIARLGSWRWEAETDAVWWSEELHEINGTDPKEPAPSLGNQEKLYTPESWLRLAGAVEKALRIGEAYDLEIEIIRADGLHRWIAAKGEATRDSNGRVQGLAGTVQDITQMKQAELQIRQQLAEKEALLKEVHHRVKNNLQIISSLLHLQSASIKDPADLQMVKETENRVRSMALLHDQLYQSPDLARIDFHNFVENLATSLSQTYAIDPSMVELKVNVGHILVPVETGVPLGLIINELVTNSLKHAFPAGRKGEIDIVCLGDKDRLTLSVRDNGVGLPWGFDLAKAETLGLHLVSALTRQAHGTLEISGEVGTEFRFVFPAPGEKATLDTQ